jgi:tetratricopeptide (TPR) repeat protein
LADFTKAIDVAPKFAAAYVTRGLFLLRQGKDDQAQKDFDKTLELDPSRRESLETAIRRVKRERSQSPSPSSDLPSQQRKRPESAPNQAQDAKTLVARAAKYIQKKDWPAAVADLESACKFAPDDHWPAYQLGAVLLYAGERPRYDELCRGLLKRFADSPPVEVGDRVAKLCFMADKVVDESKVPFTLVDRAVADDKNKLHAYFLVTKGLAEYRAGNAKAAIEVLDKILPKFRGDNAFYAQGKLTLAMACKKLARDDDARKHLADAVRILDGLQSRNRLLNSPTGWHDGLFALILRREAEKLIGQ